MFVNDDVVFLTMELLPGGELLDHIVGGVGMEVDAGFRYMLNTSCRALLPHTTPSHNSFACTSAP